MGIHCEINVHKPPYGAYFGRAGSLVSGVIKYAVDEETEFTKIVVSLKGVGTLCIEDNQRNKNIFRKRYVSDETYIDLENTVQNNAKDIVVPRGIHETQFKFVIPHNVPPSLSYTQNGHEHKVICKIAYYIRIKFYTSEYMKTVKRFRSEINIMSDIIPRLTTIPIVYGDQIKLTQISSSEPNIFFIKVKIISSILKSGDKIVLHYDVSNDTNVAITAIETKLVEVYKFFMVNKEEMKIENDVPGTHSKTDTIKCGETQDISAQINLPPDRCSAEFSRLFSRDYFVSITIQLPKPHENYILEIPIQISANEIGEDIELETEEHLSYWETMKLYTSYKIDHDSI